MPFDDANVATKRRAPTCPVRQCEMDQSADPTLVQHDAVEMVEEACNVADRGVVILCP
jgi:hypothetical protein